MGTFIKPIVGKDYMISTPECSKDQTSFTGVYIGKKPAPTPEYIRILNPEGHIFIRSNDKGEIDFYLALWTPKVPKAPSDAGRLESFLSQIPCNGSVVSILLAPR